MAPNVFDYIRNCIHHRSGHRDENLAHERTKLHPDNTFSESAHNWRSSEVSRSTEKLSCSLSSQVSSQYLPSSEVPRNCIHSPPNRNVRDIDLYESKQKG